LRNLPPRKYLLAAAAAVLLVLVWALWPRSGDPDVPEGGRAQVKRGPISRLVTSTGTVTTQVGAAVKVGARVSGRVEKLLVAVGQKVEAGQVVAVIEHKDLQARLDQAQAEMEAAQGKLSRLEATGPKEVAQAAAELNEIKVQLKQAELDLKRRAQLVKDELVSREEVDKAQREVSVLSARLAAARARLVKTQVGLKEDLAVTKADLAAAEARLVTAKVNLDYATVRAPISGVVAEVSTQEGETVAASLNAPTFITIVDLGRLQVDDYVDETDVGQVKTDQKAWFTVDAFPGRRFKGRVQAIYPSAKIIDNVVYYAVIIEIQDQYQGLLKPEMTANVSIVVDRKQDALWLPAEAVRRKAGKEVVYLVENGGARPQEVETGWSQQNRIEIKKGLQEGQTVIVPRSGARPNRH